MQKNKGMKDLFVFATSSTFCTLPLVKQIYSFIQNKYDTVVIDSKIKTYEDFFLSTNHNYTINHYKTYVDYANQSILDKLWKHIKLFLFLVKIRFNLIHKYERVYLYTFELFAIAIAILGKPKNLYIIYHQYEMVLPDEINMLDKFYLAYIQKKWEKVDMAIFPEVNRMLYFQNILSEFKENQFFLLPNSNNNTVDQNKAKLEKAKIRVMHIGALGPEHHIHSVIETIKALPEDKFEFYFVGNITKEVLDKLQTITQSNIFTLPQVRHNELHELYSSADIGLILYRNDTLNTTFCAPNKLYEFWSYGIPVIGDKLPGLVSVFNDPLQGVLVKMDDSNQIKDAIISLSKIDKSNKLKIKSIFENQYKLDNYFNRFEKIIKGL